MIKYKIKAIVCLLLYITVSVKSQDLKISKHTLNHPKHFGVVMETKIDNQNIRLPMAVFLPKTYNEKDTRKYPVIIFLHGQGEGGTNLDAIFYHGPSAVLIKTPVMMDNLPFIVLSPQAQSGWAPSLMKVMKLMIIELTKSYPIDTEKIHVTGLSMGGTGTWQALNDFGDLCASATPMCGRPWVDPYEMAEKLMHHSIWNIVGGADDGAFVNGAKNMHKTLRSVGADTQLTILPDVGHFVWLFY